MAEAAAAAAAEAAAETAEAAAETAEAADSPEAESTLPLAAGAATTSPRRFVGGVCALPLELAELRAYGSLCRCAAAPAGAALRPRPGPPRVQARADADEASWLACVGSERRARGN